MAIELQVTSFLPSFLPSFVRSPRILESVALKRRHSHIADNRLIRFSFCCSPSVYLQRMRRSDERQPCCLSPALPRAGPDHLRPTHGKPEEDPGIRSGQAQGRRRGACGRAHDQVSPAARDLGAGDRRGRLCGTRGRGQHPTEAFHFPGACSSFPAGGSSPPSMVQAHRRF